MVPINIPSMIWLLILTPIIHRSVNVFGYKIGLSLYHTDCAIIMNHPHSLRVMGRTVLVVGGGGRACTCHWSG